MRNSALGRSPLNLWRRGLASFTCAAVIALLASALPAGLAFAHGGNQPVKTGPQSCFFYNKATASRSLYSGSTFIGTIEVWVAQNSCVPSNFEVGGHLDGTGGGESGCHSATVAISGTVNGVNVGTFDNSVSTTSFGVSSCSYTILSWQSGSYGAQHGDKIGACNVTTYAGAAQSSLCTSYTY